ncbi:MAG: hypothetical protein WD844_17230 [Thermoleophilaceae bacterium]
MRTLALTLAAAAAALALPACGGGDDDATTQEAGTVTTPAELPEQVDDGTVVERADFESCLEGEGLEIYPPEAQIPGADGGRLEVDLESAEQIAVFWPESQHVADAFVAEDGEATERAEQEIVEFLSAFGGTEEQVRQFVQRAGNVIVTPDNDSGPDEDELAVLRDCIR